VITLEREPTEQIYPIGWFDAADHEHAVAIHPGLGVPVYSRDPNGVETRSRYDAFGRPRSSSTEGAQAAVATIDYGLLGNVDRMEVEARVAEHARSAGSTTRPAARASDALPDGWVPSIEYDDAGRSSSSHSP
jgi:YD repeat-containing protein